MSSQETPRGSSSNSRALAAILSNVLTAALVLGAVYWVRKQQSQSVKVEFSKPPTTGANVPTTPTGPRANSALDIAHPIFPPSTFERGLLSYEEDGKRFDAPHSPMRYDRYTHFAFTPGLDRKRPAPEDADGQWILRTNSAGLRDDDEPIVGPVDLRVLVSGDSHTAGFCDNSETFSQRLENELRLQRPGRSVEVVNVAVPGWSFFQHLGALERALPNSPDVFVVVVYGGNDFLEVLGYQHRFHNTPRGDTSEFEALTAKIDELQDGAMSQGFLSILQYQRDPSQIEVSLQAARDYTTEIIVTCLRHGVRPVFAYLPPVFDVDESMRDELCGKACEILGVQREDTFVIDRMANSWIEFVRQTGTPLIDLRPAFRQEQPKTPLYWKFDLHISIAGQAVVARELLPAVVAAAPIDGVRIEPGSPPFAAGSAEARALLSPGAVDAASDASDGATGATPTTDK